MRARRGGRTPAGRLVGGGRRRSPFVRRAARAAGRAAARLHGARGVRGSAGLAADPERQGRPQGAARAGRERAEERLRRAAQPDRRAGRRASGPTCSASSRSASRTTSSSWAATRCWRRGSSRGCARLSGSSCRCARSSRRRRWRALAAWIDADGGGKGLARRSSRCGARSGTAICRSPSPRSGSGSSTSSSPAARSTTSRPRCGCTGGSTAGVLARSLQRSRAPPRGAAHHVRRAATASRSRSSLRPPSCALPVDRPLAACPRSPGRPSCAGWRPRKRPRPFDLGAGPLLRVSLAAAGRAGARAASARCTTSSATAGRSACSCARWRPSTRRSRRGAAPPLPSCRSSTPTSPSGSASWLQGEALERQLAWWRNAAGRRAGGPGAADRPPASGRVDRARRSAAARFCPASTGAAPPRALPPRSTRRCSWCCSRPSRPCCTG